MPDTYEFTITVKKNGRPFTDFDPIVKRITCAESQLAKFNQDSGGGALPYPPTVNAAVINLFLLQVDQIQSLVLGTLSLTPGCLVLLLGATPTSGTLTNASGNEAINSILMGGT